MPNAGILISDPSHGAADHGRAHPRRDVSAPALHRWQPLDAAADHFCARIHRRRRGRAAEMAGSKILIGGLPGMYNNSLSGGI